MWRPPGTAQGGLSPLSAGSEWARHLSALQYHRPLAAHGWDRVLRIPHQLPTLPVYGKQPKDRTTLQERRVTGLLQERITGPRRSASFGCKNRIASLEKGSADPLSELPAKILPLKTKGRGKTTIVILSLGYGTSVRIVFLSFFFLYRFKLLIQKYFFRRLTLVVGCHQKEPPPIIKKKKSTTKLIWYLFL